MLDCLPVSPCSPLHAYYLLPILSYLVTSQSHSVPHTQYRYVYVFHPKNALFLVVSTTACCLSSPIAKFNKYSCTVSKQLRPCTFSPSSVLDVLQSLATFWYKYLLARHTSHALTNSLLRILFIFSLWTLTNGSLMPKHKFSSFVSLILCTDYRHLVYYTFISYANQNFCIRRESAQAQHDQSRVY